MDSNAGRAVAPSLNLYGVIYPDRNDRILRWQAIGILFTGYSWSSLPQSRQHISQATPYPVSDFRGCTKCSNTS